jgi:biotin synthesis protein BioG
MKSRWLHRKNAGNLIVFCSGWGMDCMPFRPLSSENYDVLVCYDYADHRQVPDIKKYFDNYETLLLVSWSMGVIYGQRYFSDVYEMFKRRIAINGTLIPIHDDFGIPRAVFDATLQALGEQTEDTLHRFYRRMCRPTAIFDRFMANRPRRSGHDQLAELETIGKETAVLNEADSIYTEVVVSTKDVIVPTRNQLQFWRKSPVKSLDAAHFPFYLWAGWDEMMDTLSR